MEKPEQNPAQGCKPLPSEVQTQLDFLNQAEYYLNFILAGLLLRYRLLYNQRALLLDSICQPESLEEHNSPDSFQMEIAASLLVLYALFGFHQQAQQAACLAGESGAGVNQEVFLSAVVIVVALIRLRQVIVDNEEASLSPAQQESLDIPDTL